MSVGVQRPSRYERCVFRFGCYYCDWVGDATSWFEAGIREFNEHWDLTHRTDIVHNAMASSAWSVP